MLIQKISGQNHTVRNNYSQNNISNVKMQAKADSFVSSKNKLSFAGTGGAIAGGAIGSLAGIAATAICPPLAAAYFGGTLIGTAVSGGIIGLLSLGGVVGGAKIGDAVTGGDKK